MKFYTANQPTRALSPGRLATQLAAAALTHAAPRTAAVRSPKAVFLSFAFLVALFLPGPGRAEELDSFLKRISDPSGDVRRAAWEGAGPQGPAAIAPLAAVASGENMDAALAALRAIDKIAHSSAAPESLTRKAVAAALAALVGDAKVTVGVRNHVLDLLGSVGEEEVVPALGKALLDTEVRDFARKALERIPGDAAAKALMAATAGASGEWLEALITTVGNKRASCCLTELTRLANSGGSAGMAAGKALARIAEPVSVPTIIKLIKESKPPERGRLTDDFVRMGDILAGKDSKGLAARVYEAVLNHAEDEGPRYAAFLALAQGPAAGNVALLMDGVGDRSPAVRGLALELLEKAGGTDVNKGLFERLASSKGARKAAFLRVLAARKAPGVDRSIQEALTDADIDVKITALDLAGKLGDPSNEAALVAALQSGSPAVKAVAVKAYLDLADSRLAAGEKDGEGKAGGATAAETKAAEAMYLKVLEASSDPRDKGRALLGIAAAGNPAHLGRIEEARTVPELAASANAAYVIYAKAMGKAGEKEKAQEMLLGVVTSGASRETIRTALEALKELGGDPTAFQKKQGLLASWYIVGPFPNEGGRGFAAVYSPEKEVNLTEQVDERNRKRKWAEYHSPNLDGKVDFRQVFQRSNDVCAYAYAELDVPAAEDVKLKIGSDDGVVVWLSGKKVHSNDVVRPCQSDQDVVEARLEAGVNRLLVKVTQGGGEWEFIFRITDRQDRPLDLTRFKVVTGSKGR